MLSSWIFPLAIDIVAIFPPLLLGRKKRIGWLFMLFEMTILWPLYAVSVSGWGWFPGIILHSYLAFQGWILWGKTEKSTIRER